jgi:hypothetical protein
LRPNGVVLSVEVTQGDPVRPVGPAGIQIGYRPGGAGGAAGGGAEAAGDSAVNFPVPSKRPVPKSMLLPIICSYAAASESACVFASGWISFVFYASSLKWFRPSIYLSLCETVLHGSGEARSRAQVVSLLM